MPETWPPCHLVEFAAAHAVLRPEGFVIPAVWGACSIFGGPEDEGIEESETGAITGERLGGLDPNDLFCAMRWEYIQGPFSRRVPHPERMKLIGAAKRFLQDRRVIVIGPKGWASCRIVDWGPHRDTRRVIDLSPGAARRIGAQTDDIVVCHWANGEEHMPQ